jgi:hypothetical protein
MEIFIGLIVIVYVAYRLFKANTIRGIEAIRAYAFMEAKRLGYSDEHAEEAASYDFVNGPTEMILHAKEFIETEYNGKQIPLIADAYKGGMTPRLPVWQRRIMGF